MRFALLGLVRSQIRVPKLVRKTWGRADVISFDNVGNVILRWNAISERVAKTNAPFGASITSSSERPIHLARRRRTPTRKTLKRYQAEVERDLRARCQNKC